MEIAAGFPEGKTGRGIAFAHEQISTVRRNFLGCPLAGSETAAHGLTRSFPSVVSPVADPRADDEPSSSLGNGKEAACEVEHAPRGVREGSGCDNRAETVLETLGNEAAECSATRKEERNKLIETIERIFDPEDLPQGFHRWTEEDRYTWIVEKASTQLLNLPESMADMIPSLMSPGDCGRPAAEKPDWLDLEKFRRGQRFAAEHAFGLYFANMMSLFILFTSQDALRPMIISGKSGTPYLAFKRYLSTVRRVRSWYRSDPWTKGSLAYKDMQAVRKMHLSIRQQLCEMSTEEIESASRIENAWCPARSALLEDFRDAIPAMDEEKCLLRKWAASPFRPKPLNQGEMAATQFAFMGLAILYPDQFGIHYATEEDFDSFCYLWRCIGYLLGMEDRYNFCRGSLEEIKQRSRDMIESYLKPNLRDVTSEWKHMTGCLVAGVNYYFPGAVYASTVLYLCQLINVPLPRYRAAVGFTAILYMEYQRLVLCYLTKWRTLKRLLNKLVDYAIDAALRFDPKVHARLEQKSASVLSQRPLY